MDEITELLEEYIDNGRDVTFPIDYRDSSNVSDTSDYYGFSTDGSSFNANWTLQFSGNTRITASFTGVLFAFNSGGSPELRLRIFSAPPLNRITGLPRWYPLPKFAIYKPFSRSQFRQMIEDLLTQDRGRIETLVGSDSDEIDNRIQANADRLNSITDHYRSHHTLAADAAVTTGTLITDFLSGSLVSGIPVSAGTILFKDSRDLIFTLHPEERNAPVLDLFSNPNYYFNKWSRRIENLPTFPNSFKSQLLAPPVSTGNVVYVSHGPAPGFTPIYADLFGATQIANENDIVLILDKGNYRLDLINKFISVIGLMSSTDETDITSFDNQFYNMDDVSRYMGSPLSLSIARNYPVVTNPTSGERGIKISYHGGQPSPNGLIFLSNIAVVGNTLNVAQEMTRSAKGGAGIFVNGNYFRRAADDSMEQLGDDFSQVHIHNCGVVHNIMMGFPLVGRSPGIDYCGGGILCYYSSPMISNCLIKGNTSYLHGGGIGIFKYGWPTIVGNAISHNQSLGHPAGDFDGGEEAGGNGDGGGIGVFQAYPTRRNIIEEELGFWDVLDGSAHSLLLDAWEPRHLRRFRTRWIHIHNNAIHHNKAEMSGGGVYGTVCAFFSMYNNNIYENTAVQQDGGGVAVTYGSQLRMNGPNDSSNRIANNTANRMGGGLYIRSSKVSLNNIDISGNTIPGSDGKGGGIIVESKAEIFSGMFPKYDIILHVVFTHIDRVELVIRNSQITNNRADEGAGIGVYKNISGYQNPVRATGVVFGLIGSLDIYLSVNSAAGVNANITDDFHISQGPTTISAPWVIPVEYTDATNTVIEQTI